MNLGDTRHKTQDKRHKCRICILAFSFWFLATGSPLKPVRAFTDIPVNKQTTGGFNRYFYQTTDNLNQPPLSTGRFNRYFYQTTDNNDKPAPTKSSPQPYTRSCQGQDIKTLTNQLLQDLPAYANRASQRARRLSRKSDFYSYMLVAGRPEFEPLTLGPGVYTPSPATDSQIQQIFFTTLERQYTAGQAIELQEFHWVFLTQTRNGWRLATMFSQTGGYPTKKPPTPPRESSDGVIAQAIEAWLRDCHASD